MNSDDSARPDEGPESSEELHAIDMVIERLAERFPTVSRERIESIVEEEARSLDDGKVRDFVPVLVEHDSRERLRLEADPAPLDIDAEAARLVPTDEPVDEDPMEIERRSRSTGLYLGSLDN